MRYNGDGDGSWGIISDDGGIYLVSGDSYFPIECQVSGLRVEFVGYLHHAGPPSGWIPERFWEDSISLTVIEKIQ